MLKGENIQSARHNEVVRKERIEHAKQIGKTAVKAVLVVGVTTAGYNYLQKKGFSSFEANVIGGEAIRVGRSVVNSMLR